MAKSILSKPSNDGCQPGGYLYPNEGTAAKMAESHVSFKITYI